MNTNDKATARPWTIEDWIRETERLSNEITKLVNEHAALNAVAEAARDAFNVLDSLNLRPGHQCTATELQSALAALDQVRESGVKP